PRDTPVMLVRRCSLPDQQTFQCTLGEVAGVLAPGKVRPPIIAIVGPVAQRRDLCDWFAGRPLFGQTVLVTRPRDQADAMVHRLHGLGAEALVQPAIAIEALDEFDKLDDAIGRIDEFDWLVFSSRNGVEAFLERLYALGRDARALGNAKLAAIGSATVQALSEQRLMADLCPDEHRAVALAQSLAEVAGGKRFLLLRASRGREVLAERLQAAGAGVEQVVVYRSVDVSRADPDLAAAMEAGRITWTTVTSSAIARSLVKLFGESLRNTRLAAVSPLTAGVLAELGYPAAAIAEQYTTDGLIDALLRSPR
ncbi:MAG: uroporphyrinogen-III synthase, partial [Planctomycetales bacterium]|nr:uroporphyrinogen-III synthase [Planctomycetales bacterium]